MANIKGQLEDAQLQNRTTDPTNLPDGLVWLNTTSDTPKISIDGVAKNLVIADKA